MSDFKEQFGLVQDDMSAFGLEAAKAGGGVAAGAAVGAGASAAIGGMGLAVGGTAVAVTMLPMVIAGGVVGGIIYGAWRIGKAMGGKK